MVIGRCGEHRRKRICRKLNSTLNGMIFADMLRAGAINLRSHKQAINNLNVFPIPDGDTGDNMLLTIMGGIDVINNEMSSLTEVSRKAADGMLLSARGNSDVILSQFLKEFQRALKIWMKLTVCRSKTHCNAVFSVRIMLLWNLLKGPF